MNFKEWLVITHSGEVGNLIAKINSTEGVLYITDIPNKETETTAYTEDEIELLNKNDFRKREN